MKTICLSFDNFDFVVDTFKNACVNGIITMVENAIFISPYSFHECINRWMLNCCGHRTPFINLTFGFLTRFTHPYQLQLILENHDFRYGFVQVKKSFKVFFILKLLYVIRVFQEEVFASLYNLLVRLRCFCLYPLLSSSPS